MAIDHQAASWARRVGERESPVRAIHDTARNLAIREHRTCSAASPRCPIHKHAVGWIAEYRFNAARRINQSRAPRAEARPFHRPDAEISHQSHDIAFLDRRLAGGLQRTARRARCAHIADSERRGSHAHDPRFLKLNLAVAVVLDVVETRRIRVGGGHKLHAKIPVDHSHRHALRHDVGQIVRLEAVPRDDQQPVESRAVSFKENVLNRCERGRGGGARRSQYNCSNQTASPRRQLPQRCPLHLAPVYLGRQREPARFVSSQGAKLYFAVNLANSNFLSKPCEWRTR